ncbi:hypothetical protein ACFLZO_00915 [Patescibacteria group bacterium]
MTDDQKRILGAIGFVIATIVIAILLFLMFFGTPQDEQVPVIDDTGTTTSGTTGGFDLGTSANRPTGSTTQPTPEDTTPEEVQEPVSDDQGDVSRIAAAFAERYGSFSSRSDFSNLIDLKSFMTQDLAVWADGYIEDAMAEEESVVPFGVTTRALIITVDSLDADAGVADVTVKTQRSERSGVGADRIYYQDLMFDFVKRGDSWKVDSVTWQDEDEEL